MVVEQLPSGGAERAGLAELRGDVAEQGAVFFGRGPRGLLDLGRRPPGHGVVFARQAELLAGGLRVAPGGQRPSEEITGARVFRREGGRGAEQGDARGRLVRRRGRGLPEEAGELVTILRRERSGLVFADRRHVGFVACRGADDGRHPRAPGLRQHGAEVGLEIPRGRRAEVRAGLYDTLADHAFHKLPALVCSGIEERVEQLDEGESARGAHGAEGPWRQRARGVDRGHAIGAEEFVVANVEDKEVGIVIQRLPNLVDDGKRGHGSGSHVNHLHLAAGPKLGKHCLEERGHGHVARLRVALRGRFAEEENTHGVGRFRHKEVVLFAETGPLWVGKEIRSGGGRFDQTDAFACGQAPSLADEGGVTAEA